MIIVTKLLWIVSFDTVDRPSPITFERVPVETPKTGAWVLGFEEANLYGRSEGEDSTCSCEALTLTGFPDMY
jgi:hypothetical protein